MLSLFRRADTILEIKPPKPARTGSLGEKQLRWCREKISNFEHCQKAADAAAEHTRQVRERLEGKR